MTGSSMWMPGLGPHLNDFYLKTVFSQGWRGLKKLWDNYIRSSLLSALNNPNMCLLFLQTFLRKEMSTHDVRNHYAVRALGLGNQRTLKSNLTSDWLWTMGNGCACFLFVFNKVVWWLMSKDIAPCLALGAHSVLTKTLFDQTLVRLPWVHFSTQPPPWTPSCLQPAKLSFSKNHAKSARIPLLLMSPLRTFYSLNPSPHLAPWL